MRRLFTLFLGLMFVSGVFAQKPEGIFKKASVAPVLDGVIDEVWSEANEYFIDKNFQQEVPTLSTVNPQTETSWRGLWTEEGVYVLLKVMDDAYYPNYISGGANDYDYDKTEIYFDVNSYDLQDGLGCSGGANGNQGHYQFAPSFTAANTTGTLTEVDGYKYAILVEEPNYVQEYFIPFSKFVQKEGMGIDMTGNIGFDVTIIDREVDDAARKRSVWSNIGAIGESWANMDDCGIITFDGVGDVVDITSISLEGGSITEDNAPFQVVATILPENATNKTLKWSVATKEGSTGRASISSSGVVTPVMDGVVVVTAMAMDASYEEATCEITISGQKITVDEVNVIKNGNFDLFDATTFAPTSWGNWVDGAVPSATEGGVGDSYGLAPIVTEGVAVLQSTGSHPADQWHYQFNQQNLTAQPDIPYIFKFKAWAENDRRIATDFEDIEGNGYARYGKSTHAFAVNGESEWSFDVTTEPTWFTFDVNFDRILPTTVQKVQFMISQAVGTVYIDSVSLVSEADMGLVPVLQNKAETFKVYPNPVDTKLHVTLSSAGERVAIYNSLGVKMEEVVVPGTHHVFDVSRYSRGLYFVKSKDTVVKFVK